MKKCVAHFLQEDRIIHFTQTVEVKAKLFIVLI